MSRKFEPGDFALTIVSDAEVPQGSQVEIVGKIEKGQVITTKGDRFVAPTPGWFVTHQCIAPRKTAYGDGELIPLRGDFVPDQQKLREVIA